MAITTLTPSNQLFSPGKLLTVSEPFRVSSPMLIVAFGLSATTRITAEMLDMVSSLPDADDVCIPCGDNSYPGIDSLVVVNAQPVCSFNMCSTNYIASLVVPGFYRLKMNDSLSLSTVKVWTQATSFDVLNHIQCNCVACS